MDKQKRWQFYLIVAVLLLTLYNILPTIFYYSKPLHSPVDAARAEQVAADISERTNELQQESKEWLASFSNLLKLRPTSIMEDSQDPRIIRVAFPNSAEAATFKKFLPRAGALIPFVPAQLELYQGPAADANTVLVSRQIGIKLDQSLFQFTDKFTEDGHLAPLYKQLTIDRLATIAHSFASEDPADKEAAKNKKPVTLQEVSAAISSAADSVTQKQPVQLIDLNGQNAFVKELVVNWEDGTVSIRLLPEVQKLRAAQETSEEGAFKQEQLNQRIINEIARVSRQADETILPNDDAFVIRLNTLPNAQSFLVLPLSTIAEKQLDSVQNQIEAAWIPASRDLARDRYPIRPFDAWKKESPADQRLGLVLYAPTKDQENILQGLNSSSLYVIAKGLDSIAEKFAQTPESEEAKHFMQDLETLNNILRQNGFIGYSGSSFGLTPEFSKDYIFEWDDYYSNLLKATREDFQVQGTKRFAKLDFTDMEQRILTLNRIDDRKQEDLLKWKEEYDTAQVDMNASMRYLIPKPTENPFWQNFKINIAKYFRGDDRKILKWGLDLSGGKTVRIGLRDSNNLPVTQPDDLKQAVNELYTRINKMGVSERSIHIENNNIVLDFPGSQNMSASDLVKASAMYFHIVNEKFTPANPALRDAVNSFLQDVWNEAVVTNRKDIESINEIAYQHLGAQSADGQMTRPAGESARQLVDAGLRLLSPKDKSISGAFNDTVSAIAMMRGEDFSDWDGQTHPLIVVFRNFALEGASLTNVVVGYDASEGNVLNFAIKSAYEGSRGGSPRDDFYAWTSQFAEDRIVGTPKEQYSHGRGWRMAVILNGSVITKPALRAALRDGATISGRFSQREINQLAADLKAGSLSFTPRILSEQNVSPELGQEERFKGVLASAVSLLLVIVAMIGYYRFAGLVASVAVVLNIFIMWGVLQNLDAALTLPGIAGIVLTIGMAIDANVLVFERIREEFKQSGRIASAIQAGYRKAFSAIVDSNITSIIAALILIQFDSGPIKSFAVVLIIGILSSMFTALFMTRYFFAGWVQNPKHRALPMAQFIGNTSFPFLSKAKAFFAASLVIVALGAYAFTSHANSFFGMDFTGGYSLVVDLQDKGNDFNYRLAAMEALENQGATKNDFQVRELSYPNQLRLQLGMGMEEKGHPFYQMPESIEEGRFAYPYQKNPRIDWVINALNAQGLEVQPTELASLDSGWSVMSGQFSDTMRNNAVFGLALALLSILIYITVRFEFKYAIASVIGLVFDVIVTLSILALFHWFGFQVQIDLQVVGAIMTIIGYALNDKIIVFDRIREDLKLFKKLSFGEVVNHALNVTLARTLMTSGTTLMVLLVLVFLGGPSIFAFSLVMTIGVVVGTLSSLFIAAPALVYFHDREEKQRASATQTKRA